jgi:alpha-tubulin suppressor-like RCC1 family protein
VYTCGNNTHGQLGHGDTIERLTPAIIQHLTGPTEVVQVAAGPSYTFAVTADGLVYSFGSYTNFCLGHGGQSDELAPRVVQSFKTRDIHVVRVSAGDEHASAIDSSGYVCKTTISFFFISVFYYINKHLISIYRFIHGEEGIVGPLVMVTKMISLLLNW